MTCTSLQRFKEDLSSDRCQKRMKFKIKLAPPLWRKSFQTMPNSIVLLTPGSVVETKSRKGFKKSLDKYVQKRAIKGC